MTDRLVPDKDVAEYFVAHEDWVLFWFTGLMSPNMQTEMKRSATQSLLDMHSPADIQAGNISVSMQTDWDEIQDALARYTPSEELDRLQIKHMNVATAYGTRQPIVCELQPEEQTQHRSRGKERVTDYMPVSPSRQASFASASPSTAPEKVRTSNSRLTRERQRFANGSSRHLENPFGEGPSKPASTGKQVNLGRQWSDLENPAALATQYAHLPPTPSAQPQWNGVAHTTGQPRLERTAFAQNTSTHFPAQEAQISEYNAMPQTLSHVGTSFSPNAQSVRANGQHNTWLQHTVPGIPAQLCTHRILTPMTMPQAVSELHVFNQVERMVPQRHMSGMHSSAQELHRGTPTPRITEQQAICTSSVPVSDYNATRPYARQPKDVASGSRRASAHLDQSSDVQMQDHTPRKTIVAASPARTPVDRMGKPALVPSKKRRRSIQESTAPRKKRTSKKAPVEDTDGVAAIPAHLEGTSEVKTSASGSATRTPRRERQANSEQTSVTQEQVAVVSSRDRKPSEASANSDILDWTLFLKSSVTPTSPSVSQGDQHGSLQQNLTERTQAQTSSQIDDVEVIDLTTARRSSLVSVLSRQQDAVTFSSTPARGRSVVMEGSVDMPDEAAFHARPPMMASIGQRRRYTAEQFEGEPSKPHDSKDRHDDFSTDQPPGHMQDRYTSEDNAVGPSATTLQHTVQPTDPVPIQQHDEAEIMDENMGSPPMHVADHDAVLLRESTSQDAIFDASLDSWTRRPASSTIFQSEDQHVSAASPFGMPTVAQDSPIEWLDGDRMVHTSVQRISAGPDDANEPVTPTSAMNVDAPAMVYDAADELLCETLTSALLPVVLQTPEKPESQRRTSRHFMCTCAYLGTGCLVPDDEDGCPKSLSASRIMDEKNSRTTI